MAVWTRQRFLICKKKLPVVIPRPYSTTHQPMLSSCSPSPLDFTSSLNLSFFFLSPSFKLQQYTAKKNNFTRFTPLANLCKSLVSSAPLCLSVPVSLSLSLCLSLSSYSRHVSGLSPSQIWEVGGKQGRQPVRSLGPLPYCTQHTHWNTHKHLFSCGKVLHLVALKGSLYSYNTHCIH